MQWVKNHPWIGALISVLIVLLAAAAGVSYLVVSKYQSTVVTTAQLPIDPVTSPTPTPTPDPLGPYSILLLGHGGPDHDGGSLTDTMILAYIQPRKNSIHLISLPRDIWVELPLLASGTKGYKLNAAYAIGNDQQQYQDRPDEFKGLGGGGSLAKHAVAQVTGIQPTYFLAVNFYAFEEAIDALGGITVRVSEGFDDPFYPVKGEEKNTCGKSEEEIAALSATMSGDVLNQQFPCRYEHIYFDAGAQEMDGATALQFVRSRHSNQAGNDFSRAQRQQAVIEGVKLKIIALQFIPKIIPLMNSLARNIQSDIDAPTLSELVSKIPDLQTYKIYRVVLSEQNILTASRSPDRQYVLIPKEAKQDALEWSSVHDFIRSEINSSPEK